MKKIETYNKIFPLIYIGVAKMTYSLNSHPLGYALQKDQAFCNLLTCTGFSYGMRHRELAQGHPANWLGHTVLFVVECIPVIGMLVAGIECLVARYFQHLQPPALPPLPTPFIEGPEAIVESLPVMDLLPDQPIIPLTESFPVVDPLPNQPILLDQEPLPPFPTDFDTSTDLLKEAEDYFNNAEIPSPLCFPEIDLSAMSQKDLIETLLKKYNGLCIGEYHDDSSPKYFLTIHMPLFKTLGVTTLYLEGYDDCQKELDDYYAGESIDIPQTLLEKILSFAIPDIPGSYTELDVLRAAKKEGIRLVNIDSSAARTEVIGIRRAAAMNYQAKLIIDKDRAEHSGGKCLIYVGSAHANRIAGLPGLGQMYQFPSFLIKDISFTLHKGADAVRIPHHDIHKEIQENNPSNKRVKNIDFLIQMHKPIKID